MKRTGVIVAMVPQLTTQQAAAILERLEATFPSVEFVLVAGGAGSIAFDFDDDDTPDR